MQNYHWLSTWRSHSSSWEPFSFTWLRSSLMNGSRHSYSLLGTRKICSCSMLFRDRFSAPSCFLGSWTWSPLTGRLLSWTSGCGATRSDPLRAALLAWRTFMSYSWCLSSPVRSSRSASPNLASPYLHQVFSPKSLTGCFVFLDQAQPSSCTSLKACQLQPTSQASSTWSYRVPGQPLTTAWQYRPKTSLRH